MMKWLAVCSTLGAMGLITIVLTTVVFADSPKELLKIIRDVIVG